MDPKLISSLIALFLLSLVRARCPKPNELPIKYSSSKFMCARVYKHSHWNPDVSCFGRQHDIYNGQNTHWVGTELNDEVSSIVVRPGCFLRAYEHADYEGKERVFIDTNYRLKNVLFYTEPPRSYDLSGNDRSRTWNDEISSWSCNCQFSNAALTCRPTEEYSVLRVCRNPSPGKMECHHTVSKGMEIGNSMAHGRSEARTIEASISSELAKAFTLSLKYSRTTTFDWSRTGSETFSKTTTTTVKCDVEPGHSVQMLQVIGRCGDTVVYTGHYECRNA